MLQIRLNHIVWAAVLIGVGAWLGWRIALGGMTSSVSSGLVMARIVDVVEEGTTDLGAGPHPYQVFRVEILGGEYAGSRFTVDYGLRQVRRDPSGLEAGDRILVNAAASPDGKVQVYFADFVRTGALGWMAAAFAVLILLVSRGKGLRALAGMVLSLMLIVGFILPQILKGADPVFVSLVGSFALLTATFYLVHGWTLKSHTSVLATLGALIITAGLAAAGVAAARLTGYGSEEALFLTQLAGNDLNLRGLLLGGILVGALGVLDDLTINQVSAVFELRRANPALGIASLYRRAMVIGQDHIAATVNTLLLAYVGASLPLLLLFSLFQEPALAVLNREAIAEEIVRTLVGSIGLISAVPLATILAAAVAANRHRLAGWLGPDTSEAEAK